MNALRRVGLLSLIAVTTCELTPARAQQPTVMAYYDPDANHNSIPEIVDSFNRYLRARELPVVVQAVLRREDLESLLRRPDTAFAMVASNYLTGARRERLTPILVPTAAGEPTYRKILVDNGEGSRGALEGATIAATVPGANNTAGVNTTLELLRGEGVSTGNVTLLPVSKDIDALLALSFGQVRAALVTQESISVMEELNPTAASQLRIIFRTSPILRPPLCRVVGHGSDREQAQLMAALSQMPDNRLGRRVLFRMGLEDWTAFHQRMLP